MDTIVRNRHLICALIIQLLLVGMVTCTPRKAKSARQLVTFRVRGFDGSGQYRLLETMRPARLAVEVVQGQVKDKEIMHCEIGQERLATARDNKGPVSVNIMTLTCKEKTLRVAGIVLESDE